MKKWIVSSILLILSSVLFSTTANASDQQAIQLKRETTEQQVLSVDVRWGSLEFTYLPGKQQIWNPQTHEYTTTNHTARWEHEEGADQIEIVNHSSTPITPEFTCQPNTELGPLYRIEKINGQSPSILPPSEGDSAGRNAVYHLIISGTLKKISEPVSIGTVTLKIDAGRYHHDRYSTAGKDFYALSGVQGNQLLLGRFYQANRSPNETALASRKRDFMQLGNRMIKISEAARALRVIAQTAPDFYQTIQTSTIICEDGIYQIGTGTPSNYFYVEVMVAHLT